MRLGRPVHTRQKLATIRGRETLEGTIPASEDMSEWRLRDATEAGLDMVLEATLIGALVVVVEDTIGLKIEKGVEADIEVMSMVVDEDEVNSVGSFSLGDSSVFSC